MNITDHLANKEKQTNKQTIKRNEDNLRDLWDNVKWEEEDKRANVASLTNGTETGHLKKEEKWILHSSQKLSQNRSQT